MVNVAERTLNEVDVVLWLVEPSTFIGAGERHILEQLQKTETPVILVINKMDMVKREELLEVMKTYSEQMAFAEVIPCCAFTGENCQDVIGTIIKYLPEGPKFYDDDVVTDQPERQIVAELIREKVLRLMDAEIPHGIAVAIDSMKMRRHGHIMDVHATIVCEKDSHKGMIIGKQGQMLKQIGKNARIEIENLLDTKVNLQLWVKVKKDWRDSDFLIKNFGYDRKDY